MKVHRINVLGASGGGASTLGRANARALHVPYFDSDDFYHEPTDPQFQRPREPLARNRLLLNSLAGCESWVFGGGVAGWEPYPALEFTLIVLLRTPTRLRIERLRAREHARFGERIRPGGDMHAGHEEFIAWASRYDIGDVSGKTLARHREYLNQQQCPLLELSGDRPQVELLERVRSHLEF